MMNSSQTLDPRIVQNLRVMQADPLLSKDIPVYLREIEGVDPEQYMPSPSLGQQFMRGAGLIGRMGVQGLGNLASLPFGVAGAAYQGVTGNRPPAMLQGNQGTAAANQMGLPQPETGPERIAVAAGENAAMSAVLPGAGLGLTALGAGAGAAGQTAQEAGMGPMGQMAASAAVGMGLPIVGMMGAAAIRSAIAGSATRREAAKQSMALLQAGNPTAPVTLGQVAEGGIARTMEGGLRNVPGASQTFRRTLDDQADEMAQRTTRLADRVSPAGTPTTAGAAIQRGIEQGFVPRFRAQSKQLYDRVYQLMPSATPIVPSRTIGLFAEQGNLAASARPLSDDLFASGKMGAWGEKLAATIEASPQGIPFGTLKEWRSQLGEMLNGSDLVEGIALRDVKRLYGALSDDMRAGIAAYEKMGPETAINLPSAGGHLAAFDAAAARQTTRLLNTGALTPDVLKALKRADNLGFDTPLRAANAILGEQRPGGWSRYWDLSNLSPQDVSALERWRQGMATTGPTPPGQMTAPPGSIVAAWDRAQLHWKAGADRLERVLQPLIDKKTPEIAFKALFSGSKEGATVLRSTMRSLSGGEKRIVASTVLRRLGKANPGMQDELGEVFSPETYLKRWADLSPEAKGALFEGIDPNLPKDLNALAKAMSVRKQAGRVLYNPSGTAPNTAFWSIVSGLGAVGTGTVTGSLTGAGVGAAVAPMASAAAAKLLAEKVFTNPRMIRWLVRQTTVPLGAISQEMAILVKDSEKWPAEDREIAQELSQTFSNIDWPQMLMATAVTDATAIR